MSQEQGTGTVTRTIARIERTYLGIEDHGILTGYLHVTYGGTAQGIGGYNIRGNGGEYVAAVLGACGVEQWEKLVGRTIYVLTDENRTPIGIEPLPTEQGKPFMFAEVHHD